MKKKYFFKRPKFLLFLLVFFSGFEFYAQSVVIFYPSPSQQITACNGSSLLLGISQASIPGGNVTITLPSGYNIKL